MRGPRATLLPPWRRPPGVDGRQAGHAWRSWPSRGARLGRLSLIWLAAIALVACAGAMRAAGSAGSSGGESRATAVADRAEVERIARTATWAPGQLQAHFSKHGHEGPYESTQAYDAGARETIRIGREFSYVDRTSRARRRGYYDPERNRFTAVTADGGRLTTHFRPEDGERYVRGLPQSTYR